MESFYCKFHSNLSLSTTSHRKLPKTADTKSSTHNIKISTTSTLLSIFFTAAPHSPHHGHFHTIYTRIDLSGKVSINSRNQWRLAVMLLSFFAITFDSPFPLLPRRWFLVCGFVGAVAGKLCVNESEKKAKGMTHWLGDNRIGFWFDVVCCGSETGDGLLMRMEKEI